MQKQNLTAFGTCPMSSCPSLLWLEMPASHGSLALPAVVNPLCRARKGGGFYPSDRAVEKYSDVGTFRDRAKCLRWPLSEKPPRQ
eukprot:1925324-Amphidinium_carterae.1